MDDYKYNTHWQSVIDHFVKALGRANVSNDEVGIRLKIDIMDKRKNEQFGLFVEKAQRGRIKYSVDAGSKKIVLDGSEIEPMQVTIPYLGNRVQPCITAAQAIIFDNDVRRIVEDNGEIKSYIAPWEPAHELEKITDVEWNRVENSPYGTTVLEPLTETVNHQQRSRREFGVGLGLLEERKDSYSHTEITDWLEQQQRIEEQYGLKPRTVIPEDWATETRLNRLNGASPTMRKALKAAFEKS